MNIDCPNCHFLVELTEDTSLLNIVCPRCATEFAVSEEETLGHFSLESNDSVFNKSSSKLGNYQLIRKIGQGAVSSVWEAVEEKLNLTVALKLPARNYSRQTIDRFQRESETIARLNHPNIAALHNWGIVDGQPYIAVEYIRGVTLSEWRSQKSPTPRQSAKLCLTLADALDHAHRKNVIHRDLKPGNILVDFDNEPHIVDFGLAVLDSQASGQPNRLVGSPAYMAPEQIEMDRMADARADLFSLGVILYELLTGVRPHSGERILGKILEERPRSPRDLNRKVPKDLDSICLKCLAKSPGQRYPDARSLYTDLAHFLAGEQLTASGGTATGLWVYLKRVGNSFAANPQGNNFALESEIQRLSSRNEMLEQRLSERMQMLIATRQELQQYHSLLESLPLCICRKDLEGRFNFVNDCFCDTFGIPAEQLLGKSSADIFTGQLAEQHVANELLVVSKGRIEESTEVYNSNGDSLVFEVLRSPVRNFNGEVVGVQALMWDISAHAKAEDALRHAKDAAEAANLAKSRFLANVSHELRTPMTAIIGVTDVLSETELNQDQRNYVSMVQQSGKSLLRIINDLLDFSKIEAGKIRIENSSFDLRAELENIVRTLEFKLSSNLHLSQAVDPSVPSGIRADAARLRQVVMNLATNAIKFTDHGEISIRVGVVESSGEKIRLRFEVSDTGIGIPPEKIPIIFQPFEQVDMSFKRRFGGAGLGLPISAAIVAAMGGELCVNSEPGKGSRFYFTIGVCETKLPSEVQPLNQSSAQASPMRILAVDDVESNRFLIEYELKQLGHKVQVADCGAQALACLEQGEFDLIFLDVQMPGMDGFETTQRIRDGENGTGRYIPIIAMTAHAMSENRDQCLDAGMDGYISKPIDRVELHGILAKYSTLRSRTPMVTTADLLDRFNGDREFLVRLLVSFGKHSQDMLRQVVDAADSGNSPDLQLAIHKLKGAVANLLGGPRLETIDTIESMARNGASDNLEFEVNSLSSQIHQLNEELNEILRGLT